MKCASTLKIRIYFEYFSLKMGISVSPLSLKQLNRPNAVQNFKETFPLGMVYLSIQFQYLDFVRPTPAKCTVKFQNFFWALKSLILPGGIYAVKVCQSSGILVKVFSAASHQKNHRKVLYTTKVYLSHKVGPRVGSALNDITENPRSSHLMLRGSTMFSLWPQDDRNRSTGTCLQADPNRVFSHIPLFISEEKTFL